MKKSRLRSILKIIRNILIGIVVTFILFCIFSVWYVNYEDKKSRPFDYDKTIQFIQDYRETKSFAWAQSGERWPSVLNKKFLHKDFDGSYPGDHVVEYIIIKNNYKVTSVKKIDTKYLKQFYTLSYSVSKKHLKEKYGNHSYEIKGKEFFLGKVENGKIIYFKEPKESIESYDIYVGENKLQIIGETMYDNYYILEKDVPLLLKRLNAEK